MAERADGIEVVSYQEVDPSKVREFATEQYGVITRNQTHYPQFNIELMSFYPDFERYYADIQASISGRPVPSQQKRGVELLCDFNMIMNNRGRIIGGFDIMTQAHDELGRTLGYYVDIEGGFGRQGVASSALAQVVQRLDSDAGLQYVDAFIHPDNVGSQKVVLGNGFMKDHGDQPTDERPSIRFIRSLGA